MSKLVTRTKAWIQGTHDAWCVANEGESGSQLVRVELCIQGNQEEGYHLIKAPSGFFTADDWFERQEQALQAAQEEFDLMPLEWVHGETEHS